MYYLTSVFSAKEGIKFIKKRLGVKNPKTQLYTLEFLEYGTCVGDQVFHEEINSKVFLQSINALFRQKMLSTDVKLKGLYLVQFWHNFFIQDEAEYPNFGNYYELVKSQGVKFPPYKESPYVKFKK